MNVIEVQNEPPSATCPHCGAEVAADQRYCLACGRPCSPARLPFLDVLQAESQARSPDALGAAPAGYVPAAAPDEGVARLGRFSGLFGLVTMLLLVGVIGLLVGHWISGSNGGSNVPKVYKVDLSGTAAPASEAAGASGGTTSPEATTGSKAKEAAATKKSKAVKEKEIASEAKEVKEVREADEAKLPTAVKPSKATEEKLKNLTGKAYEKEINKVANGPAPIETE